jgi:hypothetical protein
MMEETIEDRLWRYQKEDQQQEFEYLKQKMRLEHNRSLGSMINQLHMNGQIESADYMKWMIDQTGTFIPKIINNLPIKNVDCVNDKFQLLNLNNDK